jgi:Protein of unknown function (DUF3617).
MYIALVIVVSLVWIKNASAEMKEGQWEITTKVEMKGMPVQMPATTMKQCMTQKDMVPKPEKQPKGQECTTKDQKVSGDTVTYTIECTNAKSTMVTSGKMTYKGDSFDGTSDTTIKAKGQPEMQMTSTMSGKYLGPCPKEK